MDFQFACGEGHRIIAWFDNGAPADLEGALCPICLGKVVGHGNMIDSRLLAPVQAEG
jgi:hypothetical protein